MSRKIISQPIKVPSGVVPDSQFPLDQISHIPGQAAAIRFFDPDLESDFQAIRHITSHKSITTWMDDTGNISRRDYRDWVSKHTSQSFLFAVHDTRAPLAEIAEVRGFVYIYSERAEKYRVKRMFRQGFLTRQSLKGHLLEVSMAVRPTPAGQITHSGIMSSALRQSCLQVRALLDYPKNDSLTIFAFIDPHNIASIRAIESSGFIRRGAMKYDSDSSEIHDLYTISWRKLHSKIRGGLRQLYNHTPHTPPIDFTISPQITDSHCGPAVIQSLLAFNHFPVSQDEIVNSVHAQRTIKKNGLRPKQLRKSVEKLAPHLKLLIKEHATAKDLKILIHDFHLPVGINWQGLFYDNISDEKKYKPNQDNGHYSIVVDVNPQLDQITIADPYSEFANQNRTFSYRWFKTRWWDTEIDIDPVTKQSSKLETKKMIFVVVHRDLKLPNGLLFTS